MRNLLALVGAAVLTFAGVGWFLGWYHLEPAPGKAPGHRSVTVDIDPRKIKDDIHKGEQNVERVLEQAAQGDTARRRAAPKPPDTATTAKLPD
jgi:hypothetical protein